MKKGLRNADIVIIIISVILASIGGVMVFSASSYVALLQYKVSTYHFAIRQLIFIGGGFASAWILTKIPTKLYSKNLMRLIMILLIAFMFTLTLVGKVSHNAKSWFDLGFAKLQPSEFAKTIIILYLAAVYGSKKKFTHKYDVFLPLILPALVVLAIFMEPDRGTALIVTAIVGLIFITLPLGKDQLIKLLRVMAFVVVIAGFVVINLFPNAFGNSEVASRFNYQNPCSRYEEDSGYQVCNGYIAINNGGLFGTNLGKSTQKYLYLPEAHTDFIFAIIVEELGVLTGGIILLLYLILLFRILVISRNAKNLRNSIIAFGTFTYILVHIVVNLGGLLALIPLTGVPLPFLSYGGSFMLNLLILLGVTQRVAIETKEGMK